MKQSAMGLFLLSFVLSANPNGFAQTQEQLIAGAKKEGKLVVYASATAPQLQMYFATFNKRYPFIKTEFFRTVQAEARQQNTVRRTGQAAHRGYHPHQRHRNEHFEKARRFKPPCSKRSRFLSQPVQRSRRLLHLGLGQRR